MSRNHILLLEDQPLISLDLEDALHAAGLTDVVTLRTRSDALAWLSENSPDMVVLDLHLADGDCHEVLDVLHRRSIPAIIYSGSDMPDDWATGPFSSSEWVEKPANPDHIAAAILKKLMSSAQ